MEYRSTRHPHLPFLIILLTGVLLYLPSLWLGFLLDDYLFIGVLEGEFASWGVERSPFAFFLGDEEETARIAREGGYPWWIYEGTWTAVFRPLSELLIRVDHSLFGKAAFGYHVHSLAWWLFTMVAVGLVLRRALTGVVGALALLIFVLDEVHVLPVAWIANRNALVATALVMIGIWAHVRWREDQWRPGRYISIAGVAAGLLGSEVALSALGYLLAYELCGGPGGKLRSRVASLAPAAIVMAVYALVYRLLGYGAADCGICHDPGRDPLGFLATAVAYIPTLLASGIAGFSADFWFFAPQTRPALIVVGCLATLALLGLLRTCWAQIEPACRRGLRWLLVGSALALIPVVATFPSDRMLLVPSIGFSAALATLCVQAWRSWRARRRRWVITSGALIVMIHLFLALLLTIYVQTVLINQGRASLELAASPAVRDAAGRETVVIFAPDHVVGLYLPLLVHHLEEPAPQSWRPLSIAPYDHHLRRSGPRTLELRVEEGDVMLRSLFEVLYRDARHILPVGSSIDRGLFRAEILAARNGAPTHIAFHFDRDLDDSSLSFLVWQDGELRPADLPAVGQELPIERTLGPAGF